MDFQSRNRACLHTRIRNRKLAPNHVSDELSEDMKLMLLHPELISPVVSCVLRFHERARNLPEFLFVSMDVWNSIGRARQFEGMTVICDSKLKGASVYCTTEGVVRSQQEIRNDE